MRITGDPNFAEVENFHDQGFVKISFIGSREFIRFDIESKSSTVQKILKPKKITDKVNYTAVQNKHKKIQFEDDGYIATNLENYVFSIEKLKYTIGGVSELHLQKFAIGLQNSNKFFNLLIIFNKVYFFNCEISDMVKQSVAHSDFSENQIHIQFSGGGFLNMKAEFIKYFVF
jgi:hypothetical protein